MSNEQKPNMLANIMQGIGALFKPVDVKVDKRTDGFAFYSAGFPERLVFKHLKNLLEEYLSQPNL